jgi:hypothetical protein
MTGTNESSFQQQRHYVLQGVRAKLKSRIQAETLEKSSRTNLQDNLRYETSNLDSQEDLPEQLKTDRAYLLHASTTLTEGMVDLFDVALRGLQAGKSVYALLGVSQIPTYKAITNGDGKAGRLSAVEDITILLMSLNFEEMVDRVYLDIASAPEFSADMKPLLRSMLTYMADCYRDAILRDLTDSYIMGRSRFPLVPKTVEYENGAVPSSPYWRRFISGKASGIIDYSMYHMRRLARVPKLWPPLKGAGIGQEWAAGDTGAPVSAAEGGSSYISRKVPGLSARYDHLDFSEGYREIMTGFSLTMQTRHFDMLRTNKYAAKTKLPVIHEKKVQEAALEAASLLRERVALHLATIPKLSGVFSQGALQASDQIKTDIDNAALPPHKADALAERIMGRLKEEWRSTLLSVVKGVEEGGKIFTDPAAMLEAQPS